jgi:hypothetical protein
MAAGLVLAFGGMAAADDNANLVRIKNQVLANKVAATLQKSGNLHGSTIDVTCVDGVVELSGKVADGAQHDALVSSAVGVAGVKSVFDSMTIDPSKAVRPVQALTLDPPIPAASPAPAMLPAPNGPPIIDPIPLGQPGASSPYDMSPPRLPAYSWPTYAPYNNVSRVAYPNAYPANSFPFIGPFYPYPKVPLGWRSVTLEWQDGHWWMGRNATAYDYWRVRYW